MTSDDSHSAGPGDPAAALPVAPPPGSPPSGSPAPAGPSRATPAAPDGSTVPAPGAADAVPDEATLEAIARPASVRRAPRIGAFIRAGVLLGLVAGWLLAILFSGTTGEVRTGVIVLSAAAGACAGALLASGAAALADRRSLPSARAGAGPDAGRRAGGSGAPRTPAR